MKPKVAAKNLSKFDPNTFLSTMDGGRQITAFPKKRIIFARATRPMLCFISRKER